MTGEGEAKGDDAEVVSPLGIKNDVRVVRFYGLKEETRYERAC
jgi:hypothetical protein